MAASAAYGSLGGVINGSAGGVGALRLGARARGGIGGARRVGIASSFVGAASAAAPAARRRHRSSIIAAAASTRHRKRRRHRHQSGAYRGSSAAQLAKTASSAASAQHRESAAIWRQLGIIGVSSKCRRISGWRLARRRRRSSAWRRLALGGIISGGWRRCNRRIVSEVSHRLNEINMWRRRLMVSA